MNHNRTAGVSFLLVAAVFLWRGVTRDGAQAWFIGVGAMLIVAGLRLVVRRRSLDHPSA